MGDHPLSALVRDFYNKLDVDTNFVCRLNDADLTQEQAEAFQQLSEETKKRYYGSGMNIPEALEGKRILDIGCGSGSLVFLLSKFVGPSGSVVGLDITDGLIKRANGLVDFHMKQWGYSKSNCEFRVENIETLSDKSFDANSFDIIVSNGVFCLVPDKDKAFKNVFRLLKEGGQFYLNDVYAEKDPPEEHKYNQTLWSLGTTGAMRWDNLSKLATAVGFSAPYLTCAAPVNVVKEEYNQMLQNGRFSCAGWRLFKLPAGVKVEPSRITYKGSIRERPKAFIWDIDLTFKKGEGVDVDGELATIISNCYLKDHFTLAPASGQPINKRNQNPFSLMDQLKGLGKLPEPIYKIE